MCSLLYAQNYPQKVKALAPLSTVISGKLSFEAHPKEELEKWKKKGYLIEESSTRPGLMKKLKWSHMEDRLKYDLLPNAHKLTMPVFLLTGDNDDSAPPKHQKMLYEKLPGKKELHIIKNTGHNFTKQKELEEIKNILKTWLKNLN